ncbi:MAG: aldose epimerase family protein [Planctomycetota bacterium]|nr:aldose epimerase family protein [Planctomycetota bacterium]
MRTQKIMACLLVSIVGLAGCSRSQVVDRSDGVVRGPDGGEMKVKRIKLENGNGMEVEIVEFGATITRVVVPDRSGRPVDVVLGFDTVEEYPEKSQYFGCTVGRVGNRIAGGSFTLDGETHQLATNNGDNHLHGGDVGFDKQLWHSDPVMTEKGPGCRFTLRSPDGDEGYPGTVEAEVTYILTADDELIVEMGATTDAATPVNLVHHTYWNLGGHDSGPILDEILRIDASRYTPVDEGFIPTGELASVEGTAVDFRSPKPIGRDIGAFPGGENDPGGYDHNLCLDGEAGTMREVARLHDPVTGITMTIETDQPGIQFYTGNFLNGMVGKGGAVYEKFGGLCLETQAYPDSINHQGEDGWPDVVLRPGERYRHRMVHRFTTD